MPSTLNIGKLDAALLEELLARFPVADPQVVVGPRVGEDVAVIDLGNVYLLAKTDPITFATDQIGWYAVQVNANDIATAGAAPRWFLATLLLPAGQTTAETVSAIFDQIAGACRGLQVALVGGHTEITYDLNRPILVGQMLAVVDKDRLVTTAGAQVGDDILLTKGVAVEGTALIAREKGEALRAAGLAPELLERASQFLFRPGISVVRDALAAVEAGGVHAMHDPTEGGVATGLHEIADAAGVGLRVEREQIPILPECRALCAPFGLDPLGLIASGALLITAAPTDTPAIRAALSRAGIPSAVIGRLTPPEEGRVLVESGREVPLPRFDQDEIGKLF
jgi:hydrogenase expression/formation protein HypE